MILSLLYKAFVLLVLFFGGYVLMRYGMALDEPTSRIVACVGMPIVTFIVWLVSYRGKRFS